MEFLDTLKARHSVRAFDSKPVPEALLQQILQEAALSPSWSNTHPYRLALATGPVLESLRTELMHTGSRVRVSLVSLPGVNTPQFDWTRNKTGHDVRPVGMIYQPEVAARAIVWASDHDRKEVLVGWPTVESVTRRGEMDRPCSSWSMRSAFIVLS